MIYARNFQPSTYRRGSYHFTSYFEARNDNIILASVCVIGGQMTMINNVGQIVTSLGYPKSSLVTSVSQASIWKHLGHVLLGFISDQVFVKYQCPISLSLTIILLLSSICHLLIAFNVPCGIYVPSIIIRFCLGAEFILLYTIISEIIGLLWYIVQLWHTTSFAWFLRIQC